MYDNAYQIMEIFIWGMLGIALSGGIMAAGLFLADYGFRIRFTFILNLFKKPKYRRVWLVIQDGKFVARTLKQPIPSKSTIIKKRKVVAS